MLFFFSKFSKSTSLRRYFCPYIYLHTINNLEELNVKTVALKAMLTHHVPTSNLAFPAWSAVAPVFGKLRARCPRDCPTNVPIRLRYNIAKLLTGPRRGTPRALGVKLCFQ